MSAGKATADSGGNSLACGVALGVEEATARLERHLEALASCAYVFGRTGAPDRAEKGILPSADSTGRKSGYEEFFFVGSGCGRPRERPC